MSVSPSALPDSRVISRLRAAGCVFAEDEARLLSAAAASPADLDDMVDRRVAGYPLEHLLGWAEFCGLRISVDPGVFVPRRRTELLVRHAVALAPAPAVVVDMCCGSGAVAAALLSSIDRIEAHAVDVDPAAVRCARRNLTHRGGHVYDGDLFEPLPAALRGRVDLLIANAPYVPTAQIAFMPPEARDYEARVALDGGADGLDVQRRVISAAPQWLAPGGRVLVETSRLQAAETVEAMSRSGLMAHVLTDDEIGATAALGTMPAS